jgi:hypothetical protein
MNAPAVPGRIGVIVDGSPPPAWQAQLAENLARTAEVRVYAVPGAEPPEAWARLVGKVPALRPKTPDVEVQRVTSPRAALAACRADDVDLVVDAGAMPASGPQRFRRGIWTLRQRDGRSVGAPYAFLEEIARRQADAAVLLVRDGKAALRVAHPQVARGRYAASLDRLLQVAALLPAAALQGRDEAAHPWTPSMRPAGVAPDLALAYAGLLKAVDQWHAWTVSESWMLGIIDKPIDEVCSADLRHAVRWLGPRERSRYWADPFGVPGDPGRILCEEVVHDQPTGVLKELTLDEGSGQVRSERQVPMSVQGHLSYPFLFEHDGATWCIPESGAAGKVVIHRLDPSTGEWQPACTALDGVQAADATLFRHDGRLWIAYSDAQFGVHDSLCIAWAEQITGPWHRHPLNPVKIDARSSRPAGTVFRRGADLIRPGQDCSRTYGGAVALNRIEACTPTEYRESTVEFIRPGAGTLNPHGVHTLSAWGDRTLVDAKREWMNPWVLRYKALKRLGLGPRPIAPMAVRHE